MKTITLLLALVSVSMAANSFQWWNEEDPILSCGGWWCLQEMDQMIALDSVWVYTTDSLSMDDIQVYTVAYRTQYQFTLTDASRPGEYVSELDAWRYSFPLQETNNYIGISIPAYMLRATYPDDDIHTWIKPGSSWELAIWEANIVYWGEGTVALQRDTWASIKTSF